MSDEKNKKLYDKLDKSYKDLYTRKEFDELREFEKAVLRADPKGREVEMPVKKAAGGMLKKANNSGLKKLPTEVRNKMGYMKKGGKVKKMKKGGKVSSCSKRGDGCAVKGKTKGRMV